MPFMMTPIIYYCPTCRTDIPIEAVEFERCKGGGAVHRIVMQDREDTLHRVEEVQESDR